MFERWNENQTLHPVGRLLFAGYFLLQSLDRFQQTVSALGDYREGKAHREHNERLNLKVKPFLNEINSITLAMTESFTRQTATVCYTSVIHYLHEKKPISESERQLIENTVNRFYRLLWRTNPNAPDIDLMCSFFDNLTALGGMLQERGDHFNRVTYQVEKITYGNEIFGNTPKAQPTPQVPDTLTTPEQNKIQAELELIPDLDDRSFRLKFEGLNEKDRLAYVCYCKAEREPFWEVLTEERTWKKRFEWCEKHCKELGFDWETVGAFQQAHKRAMRTLFPKEAKRDRPSIPIRENPYAQPSRQSDQN